MVITYYQLSSEDPSSISIRTVRLGILLFFKNLAWGPYSSLNRYVLGKRMKASAKHLDFELSSHSLPAPHLVYLWSMFVFVFEGSIGLLFMYWNEKIWWELKSSPTGNCLSPWFTSLVFLLTNCQVLENWSQPKWRPWQLVRNVRPETSVLESRRNGEAGWVGGNGFWKFDVKG